MQIFWLILILVFLYLLITYFMFILIFKRIDGIILKKAHKRIYKNTEIYNDYFDRVNNWLDSKSLLTNDIFIKSNDNLKLHGIFINNNSSKKIFVVVHGYRSSALNNLFISFPMYYDKGYNILLIDQRCTGKSEGKYITMGIKESDDIISWVKYLNKKYKGYEIVLAGISMGASTILMASNELKKSMNVKYIVADCGYNNPYQEIKYIFKKYCHINGSLFLFMINNWCKLIAKFDLKSKDTTLSISKCNIPILFIHGASDRIVPVENSRLNYKNYNYKKDLLIVDAPHALSYFVSSEEYLEKIYKIL